MDIAIFTCILLIVASSVGVIVSVAYAYQEWWEMDMVERITSIIAIACCIAGMAVGFSPWY